MSYANYPYHHDGSVCTIVHHAADGRAEDYCTVCHDSYMCAAVLSAIGKGTGRTWQEITDSCQVPHTSVSEIDARDPSKAVPAGHECVMEHYQVPGRERTGSFWHDTSIIYHRCLGCGSTNECDSVLSPDRTCPLPTTKDA